MNSAPSSTANTNTRSLLLPYVLAQLGLLLIIQVITWMRGPTIDLVDGLLLVPSALLMAFYGYHYRDQLARIRFGYVVIHAATFAIVNGSYHLAAMGRAAVDADSATFSLDASWFGPLLAMCGFWSIGLVIHIIATVANRGWED